MNQLLPIRWLQRFIRRYSAQIVFESYAARHAFEETTTLRHAEVVYNSVRLEGDACAGAVEQFRRHIGLSPEQRVIGCVGQFIDRKNPLLLIEAVARLPDRENVVCLFAGEGPLQGKMEQRIKALGLSGICRIIPFQANVRPLLQAIDVLVLPSKQESFGLVLVEAAAYGKPVVACRCQGPNEIVVDGGTGFLVPQGDADALAGRIRDTLGSRRLAQTLGEAGRGRTQELFCPQANTRRLEELILQLRHKPRRSSGPTPVEAL